MKRFGGKSSQIGSRVVELKIFDIQIISMEDE